MIRHQRMFVTGLIGLLTISYHLCVTAQSDSELNPDLSYDSVFEDYIPYDFIPDKSWREANDEAGSFGGWRAYLNLVQQQRDSDLDKPGDGEQP